MKTVNKTTCFFVFFKDYMGNEKSALYQLKFIGRSLMKNLKKHKKCKNQTAVASVSAKLKKKSQYIQ